MLMMRFLLSGGMFGAGLRTGGLRKKTTEARDCSEDERLLLRDNAILFQVLMIREIARLSELCASVVNIRSFLIKLFY